MTTELTILQPTWSRTQLRSRNLSRWSSEVWDSSISGHGNSASSY